MAAAKKKSTKRKSTKKATARRTAKIINVTNAPHVVTVTAPGGTATIDFSNA